MTLVIGLTGSIGTGKSTVAQMFIDKGIPVLDADAIAREVVEPGEKTLKEIRQVFGEGVIQADGSLDRKALGAIVFQEEAKRLTLNEIIHPAIRKRMNDKQAALIDAGEPCIVLDIPLLFENDLTHTVDKIVVVYVDEMEQLRRVVTRDQIPPADAERRIKSQLSIEEKKKRADAVIDNRGTVAASLEQVELLLQKWDIL